MSKTGAMFLEQQEDNDAIIAELLEALQGVLDSGLLMGPTVLHDKVRANVRDAIAKATP